MGRETHWNSLSHDDDDDDNDDEDDGDDDDDDEDDDDDDDDDDDCIALALHQRGSGLVPSSPFSKLIVP